MVDDINFMCIFFQLPENLGAGMEDTERERRYLPPAAGTETQGLRNLPCHAARPGKL